MPTVPDDPGHGKTREGEAAAATYEPMGEVGRLLSSTPAMLPSRGRWLLGGLAGETGLLACVTGAAFLADRRSVEVTRQTIGSIHRG